MSEYATMRPVDVGECVAPVPGMYYRDEAGDFWLCFDAVPTAAYPVYWFVGAAGSPIHSMMGDDLVRKPLVEVSLVEVRDAE